MAKKNRKLKKFGYMLTASVSVAALAVCLNTDVPAQKQIQQIQETPDTIALVNNPISSVSFVNDTLEHYASALLTYQNNKIVRNFVKNSKLHRMQLPYFAHELWHHHNKKIKYWLKIRYSPAQFIQLRMHEEISANVAAILTADFEYQLAKDKDAVIKKYEKTYMGFYFNAIKNGEIKPESTKQEDLDKKYTLLMNGTIKMWEKMFKAHYTPSLTETLKKYLRDFGFRQPYPENYQKILTHMYTFGGVDLSRYIKNDAAFIDVRVAIFDKMAGVMAFNRSVKQREALINDIFQYAPYLKDFGVSQRTAVLEHIIIASRMKFELNKLKNHPQGLNSSVINATYYKVMHELAKDRAYASFIDNCADLDITLTPSPQVTDNSLTMYHFFPVSRLLFDEDKAIISKIYRFRDVDLTKFINNFDMNLIPSDKSQFMQINMHYHNDKHIIPAVVQVPMEDVVVPEDENSLSAQALTTHQPQNTTQLKQSLIKRVSQELYVQVPNFEENLLHPEALTPKARQELAFMYAQFNAIPNVFKNCNIEEIDSFIATKGHPHYFESKEHPFLPVKPSKVKNIENKDTLKRNNLAIIRRLSNRRSSEH